MGKTARRKRHLIAALAAALVLGLTAVLAYYLQETDGEEATYDMAYVSCQINEEFNGGQKTSITVKNTSNVPVYIRVRLVSYWETPSGRIAGKSSPQLQVTLADGWLQEGSTDTWIYESPVEPSDSTPNLLQAPLALSTDPEGYIQVVKVLAEAIQTDAEPEAWSSGGD